MNRFAKGSALVATVGLFAAAQHAQASTNPGYRNAVLGDGATAYYEFDTATPTDSAGGDNNAAIQGTVTPGAPSAFINLGTSYEFGGDGAVRIPDAATFDLGTGPVTVELCGTTPTSTPAATCSPTRAPAATSASTRTAKATRPTSPAR